MTKEEKQHAIDILRRRVQEQHEQLEAIDHRLAEYFDHLCEHSGTELNDENDQHNGWELLCGVRLLRLLRTYTLDIEEVQDAIFDGEGEWQQDSSGYWEHVQGGLKQPGRREPEVYRWEPFQVFCLTCQYCLKAWIPTGNYKGERRLISTERINEQTQEIEDLRRLCTRFILYGPRKINKSGYGAIANTRDFMKGDYDAQVVCTANSQEQAKILFNKTRDLLLQLDPVSGRKFNGKYLSYSATEIKFQKGAWRQATLQAIPAGGKLPDGKFASMCDGDEYGSAGYVNGRSDMGQTMAVIESSMGPRREPMTLITTTASLINSGPFLEMLHSTHRLLLEEFKYDTGEAEPNLAEDRQLCLLLEPDEWEADNDEYLLTSRAIRRKVNPMLGKIAQHSFYEDEVAKSRMDETKKKETISKLFNVYRLGHTEEWIKPDRIREMQRELRVDDCTADKGWVVFGGLDFSMGDDLWAHTYLCINLHTGEFFADCDAWITQRTLEEVSIRPLYEKWIADGWLRVCPGEVIEPSIPIRRIMDLAGWDSEKMKIVRTGVNFMRFGYDQYKSPDPINLLKAWMYELGANPAQHIVPVPQTNAAFNQPVEQINFFVKASRSPLSFSMSPLWPYCFGCCVLDKDTRMENKKPIKRNSSDACKVDPVQALCDAFVVYNQVEGTEHPAE